MGLHYERCEACGGVGTLPGFLFFRWDCNKCSGLGRIAVHKPDPVDTRDWRDRFPGTLAAAMCPKKVELPQKQAKEILGMFDSFQEVCERVDGIGEGWSGEEAILLTPDGKRWKLGTVRLVVSDDEEADFLECNLVEQGSGATKTA